MTKIQDIVEEVVEDGAVEIEDHKVHPTDPKWVDYILDELL